MKEVRQFRRDLEKYSDTLEKLCESGGEEFYLLYSRTDRSISEISNFIDTVNRYIAEKRAFSITITALITFQKGKVLSKIDQASEALDELIEIRDEIRQIRIDALKGMLLENANYVIDAIENREPSKLQEILNRTGLK